MKKKHDNQCKSSCTLYVVLFLIIFTINIGICTFLFTTNTWSMLRNVAKEGSIFQTTIFETSEWEISSK